MKIYQHSLFSVCICSKIQRSQQQQEQPVRDWLKWFMIHWWYILSRSHITPRRCHGAAVLQWLRNVGDWAVAGFVTENIDMMLEYESREATRGEILKPLLQFVTKAGLQAFDFCSQIGALTTQDIFLLCLILKVLC